MRRARPTTYALDPTADIPENDAQTAAYPSDPQCIAVWGRADCLPEFTRAVGGAVALDRRRRTTRTSIFGGSKATTTHACTVLLDTGSPATFIKYSRCGSVGLRVGPHRVMGCRKYQNGNGGGFHGIP